MEEALLPEKILVLILTLLPVKSLIRLACVSKRFRVIILSDPDFAKAHLKASHHHKTATRKLLLWKSEYPQPQLKSLDLDTLEFKDNPSVTNLTFPFGPPGNRPVSLLGSINGIVFLSFNHRIFYLWNPSIGIFKELPDVDLPKGMCRQVYDWQLPDLDMGFFEFYPSDMHELTHYGIGYLPATDDYKLFVSSIQRYVDRDTRKSAVYSTRDKAWKRLRFSTSKLKHFQQNVLNGGTFVNEALHWLDKADGSGKIIAFDLATVEEEDEMMLREMSGPNLGYAEGHRHSAYLGVSAGGFLSLTCYSWTDRGCIEVWVMKEYDVPSSWNKLYKWKFSDLPHLSWYCARVLILETSMITETYTDTDGSGLTRIDYKEGKHDTYKVVRKRYNDEDGLEFVQYQETLIWIDD